MAWRLGLGKNADWVLLADGSVARAVRRTKAPGPASVFFIRLRLPHTEKISLWADLDVYPPGEVEGLQLLSKAFSLSLDLSPFWEMARHDPLLRPMAQTLPGLRPLVEVDFWEGALKTVLGQQISLLAAGRLVEKLRAWGSPLPPWPTAWPPPLSSPPKLLPSPDELLAHSQEELRTLGLAGPKARTLLALAQRILAGDLVPERLLDAGEEGARATLTSFPGIGPWSAENLLLFTLGCPDIFPAGDLGLRRAAQKLLHLPHKPSPRELLELSSVWRPYRSQAALCLWETDRLLRP
ncbi:MAG: hypothetical protein QJR00_05565 [Bacillota bacterium]|nr:hypothetical protein [Bacillota bacterium]